MPITRSPFFHLPSAESAATVPLKSISGTPVLAMNGQASFPMTAICFQPTKVVSSGLPALLRRRWKLADGVQSNRMDLDKHLLPFGSRDWVILRIARRQRAVTLRGSGEGGGSRRRA